MTGKKEFYSSTTVQGLNLILDGFLEQGSTINISNNGSGSLIEQIMGTIFIKNSLSHMKSVNADSMCD